MFKKNNLEDNFEHYLELEFLNPLYNETCIHNVTVQ